jgi:EAL domain-containing protein (putative c-di-GMP-specific phosphodiesterase class I)
MQGYLVSKPVPIDKVIEILEHHVEQNSLSLDVIA